MTDFIRDQAEKELKHKIPDIAWTREARQMWKIYFHGRNYGLEGITISMSKPIDSIRKITSDNNNS